MLPGVAGAAAVGSATVRKLKTEKRSLFTVGRPTIPDLDTQRQTDKTDRQTRQTDKTDRPFLDEADNTTGTNVYLKQ